MVTEGRQLESHTGLCSVWPHMSLMCKDFLSSEISSQHPTLKIEPEAAKFCWTFDYGGFTSFIRQWCCELVTIIIFTLRLVALITCSRQHNNKIMESKLHLFSQYIFFDCPHMPDVTSGTWQRSAAWSQGAYIPPLWVWRQAHLMLKQSGCQQTASWPARICCFLSCSVDPFFLT